MMKRSDASRPNIFVIVVDTLRADHLSCYGYHRQTSPRLDELAREATLFSRCTSMAPWTIPSFTSIMTGLYPEQSRVVGSPWNLANISTIRLDDSVETLAERAQELGYTTVAVDNLHQMASHPSWFVRGFDHYLNPTRRPGLFHHRVLAEEVNEFFFGWLDSALNASPVFAFLHYWEPHLPYNQPAPYLGYFGESIDRDAVTGPNGESYIPGWGPIDRLHPGVLEGISLYDGEIRYLDHCLGVLLDGLAERGLLDDHVLTVTADHGESMVEHGISFDHQMLYQPTVHVPLIISTNHSSNGRVVEEMVQSIDLAPTLLDLAGDRTGMGNGISLTPWVLDQNHRNDSLRERAIHATQDGRFPARMLRTENMKLLVRYRVDETLKVVGIERIELYDLLADPYELNDLAGDGRTEELLARLQEWVTEQAEPFGSIDPLCEPKCLADFFTAPGDPLLADFYSNLGVDPELAAGHSSTLDRP